MSARITTKFPSDDRLRNEIEATVSCGECGKVLKPAGTLYRNGRVVTQNMFVLPGDKRVIMPPRV